MADKTPLRLVLDNSNNPTGLAEFQSGETIGNSFLTNSSFTIVDDSSTLSTISLGETLKIAGGSGIDTTISGDTLTISLESTVVTETSSDTLTNKSISLSTNTITGTSAELATAISDETGSGALVFANTPTLVTPNIGAATGTSLNLTNINLESNGNATIAGTLAANGGITVDATNFIVSGTTGAITTLSTLDLGHASDTTLSRSSAGVLAVEGIVVPTISSSNTLTNKTISGSSNTISNIGNSSLTNSSFTIVDDSSTTSTLSLGESLLLAGGTGITSVVSGDSLTFSLDNTAVTPASYGSSTAIPVITIDQQGRITSASTQNISTTLTIADDSSTTVDINLGSDTLKLSGDTGITTTISGDIVNIDLDNTAVTPATYGSSTAIPVLIIDQQGRITGASTQNISTTLTISDDTSSLATINLGSDTLKISGTANEIETSISGDTITIGLPDNVTIAGNLTVSGTTTTVNTTNTTVSDKLLELGTGRTGSASGDAGIVIERGDDNNIFIGYDESADVVTFGSGTFTGASTGDLTFTESNIKAANITSTGNLDIAGTSTLRGSITLGVNSGDSTEDSITVNARFVSNLEPLNNITYDLGSPNRRWRDIYLSGNTIDLNGATISGDGSGNITISATGAVLPAGSQVGTQSIATADPDTGISTRTVPLFTQASGLATSAIDLIFKSGNETAQLIFTDFTISTGVNIVTNNSGGTLFAF